MTSPDGRQPAGTRYVSLDGITPQALHDEISAAISAHADLALTAGGEPAALLSTIAVAHPGAPARPAAPPPPAGGAAGQPQAADADAAWQQITAALADVARTGEKTAIEEMMNDFAARAAATGDPTACALLGVTILACGWTLDAIADEHDDILKVHAAHAVLTALTGGFHAAGASS